MHPILEHIDQTGVVAILRGIEADKLVPLGLALADAGVGAIEVTLNSAGALAGISALQAAVGQKIPIGAGTVMNGAAARKAIQAGALFILTPHLAQETLQICLQANVPAVIGAMTPSEAVCAFELGCEMVKIFPAATLGSQYFRDFKGPLSQIPLMAVGGIQENNAAEYIRAGVRAVGAGSQLIDIAAVDRGDWQGVRYKAQSLVMTVRKAKQQAAINDSI